MPFDFASLPPILQIAVAVGVTIGVAFTVFFLASAYFGGFQRRIRKNEISVQAHEDSLTQKNTEIGSLQEQITKLKNENQLEIERQLKEKEADFSKKLDAVQAAFKEQMQIKDKQFQEQLEAVANNFANQLSAHNTQISQKDAEILRLTHSLTAVTSERDEWKVTAQNLNDLLEEIKQEQATQSRRLEDLEKKLTTSNKSNENKDRIIQEYKAEIGTLADKMRILEIQKEAMLEMMRALGVKLNSPPEEKKEDPPPPRTPPPENPNPT